MIFDAVETCAAVALAHFEADLAALCTAKGLAAAPSGWKVLAWHDAEDGVELGSIEPLLGITVSADASTQAKSQDRRESLTGVLFDAYIEHPEPTLLAQWIALAPEAVMATADRLVAGIGGGVYGASVKSLSTRIELSKGYEERGEQPMYWQRARVTVPVWDEDTGL